jgi:hypothetical protein
MRIKEGRTSLGLREAQWLYPLENHEVVGGVVLVTTFAW